MSKSRTTMVAVAIALFVAPSIASAQLPGREAAFSNDSARVTILTFPPGVGTGRHSGPEAELGIVMEGELVLDTPGGRRTLRPGSVYWIPGLTPHDVRNESSSHARLWDILLNRCE